MGIVEVASVEYRDALRAVRDMLERAGSARAVAAEDLRARRFDVMALATRAGRFGAAVELSPDMEALLARLAVELGPEPAPGAPAAAPRAPAEPRALRGTP